MSLLILLLSVLLHVFLIVRKINPALALLAVAAVAGLLLGMPVAEVVSSINSGIGSTLGGTVMVLALGAMIGKLAEESIAAQKLVLVLAERFGVKNIQWAVLCTGLLAGIPLFYNAGFVVLIPLVYAIAKTTRLPLLYVGLPMGRHYRLLTVFCRRIRGRLSCQGSFVQISGKRFCMACCWLCRLPFLPAFFMPGWSRTIKLLTTQKRRRRKKKPLFFLLPHEVSCSFFLPLCLLPSEPLEPTFLPVVCGMFFCFCKNPRLPCSFPWP